MRCCILFHFIYIIINITHIVTLFEVSDKICNVFKIVYDFVLVLSNSGAVKRKKKGESFNVVS